ncbi:MAG: 3-hydroxyacyl-CoA dehydrogenase family protein [Candidatus Binatia bacterium]
MAQNSLAIIGKSGRLAEEIFQLSREKGFEVKLHPDTKTIAPSTSFVVETLAGPEAEKREMIKDLDAKLPSSAIVLTSCLGHPVTEIASWSARPEKIVGFATFYPIKEKKVLELISGLRTEENSLKEVEAFLRAVGIGTVRVRDGAGAIFPRILSAIINEAVRSLDEGVAQAEEIDVGMRLGTNYPLGPLRWADQIGLDEVLAVLEGLQRETGDDRYRPAPLLKKMVLAGWLGERCGRGFYSYGGSKESK